jgi:hypothetical protein
MTSYLITVVIDATYLNVCNQAKKKFMQLSFGKYMNPEDGSNVSPKLQPLELFHTAPKPRRKTSIVERVSETYLCSYVKWLLKLAVVNENVNGLTVFCAILQS